MDNFHSRGKSTQNQRTETKFYCRGKITYKLKPTSHSGRSTVFVLNDTSLTLAGFRMSDLVPANLCQCFEGICRLSYTVPKQMLVWTKPSSKVNCRLSKSTEAPTESCLACSFTFPDVDLSFYLRLISHFMSFCQAHFMIQLPKRHKKKELSDSATKAWRSEVQQIIQKRFVPYSYVFDLFIPVCPLMGSWVKKSWLEDFSLNFKVLSC